MGKINNIRVLHIVENLDGISGGPSKSVPLLVKYLDKLGIENKIFTVNIYGDEYNSILDEYDYTIKKLPIKGLKKITYAPKLEQEIIDEISSNTIIHIHGVWTYPIYLGYKLAKQYKVPYIVATRGMMYEWCLNQNKYIKKLAMKFFTQEMLNNANIIHITEKGEEEALTNIGINTKCMLVPNGVELDNKFNTLDTKLLQKIVYDQNKLYIVFLGRIVHNKGLHYLVNSYEKLCAKYNNIEVLVVGGVEDQKYFDTIKKLNGIRYLGALDGLQKHTILSIASLFVLPTKTENFGISIAEAMSYKLPVITTTGTPWKEIKDKNAGWWIKLTQENVYKAMKDALECSDEMLKIKGENGFNIVKDYRWEIQAEKMKNIYKSILV